MALPCVVPTPPWTLDELKAALIEVYPFLATEEGLEGLAKRIYDTLMPLRVLWLLFETLGENHTYSVLSLIRTS